MRDKLTPTKAWFLSVLLAAALGPAALAQQPAPSEPAEAAWADEEPLRFRETVNVDDGLPGAPLLHVTSLRLPVALASVPASLSVVPRTLIQIQNVPFLGEALRNVSGLNVASGFGVHDFFVIRGFGSLGSARILTDGAAEPAATFVPLYNVERIEVLKGPATFLYGAGPLAGAVHLIRKRPVDRQFGVGSVSFGQFGTFEGTLDANRANRGGSLAFRVNALTRRSDGYRDDKPSSLHAVHPALAWRPDPSLGLIASLEYVRAEFAPDSGLPLVGNALPPVPQTRSYQSPFDGSRQDFVKARLDVEKRIGERLVLRDKLYYADLDWRADGSMLSGVMPIAPDSLLVMRSLTMLDDRQQILGNQAEAQLSFTTGPLAHHLLSGIELAQLDDAFTQEVASLPGIDLLDPVERAAEPLAPIPALTRVGDTQSLVLAPYVVDHVRLRSGTEVFAGARLDILDFDDSASGTERRDVKLSPMAGLMHTFRGGVSLYANLATAFAPPSTLAEGERVPEEARQLEVGVKKTLLGGRMMATAAAYHLEKENIAIPDDNGLTGHVGDQRSRGVELEVTADLTEGWNASGGYAFSDAVLTRFAERVLVGFVPPTYATVDRSGNAPAFAPRHILNLWLSRKLGWGLGVGAGARYVGNQYIAEDNTFEIDDYWLLNAALSYQRNGWRWSVNLENLTDREYQTRGFAGYSVIPGNPFAAYAKLELSLGSR